MREEQKKVVQKEMNRLKHLGIIRKGLTGYSSPVVLVKRKNQNLYLTSAGYLYQYMTYKRKPKSLNGQKKPKKLSMKLKSY